LVAKLKRFYFNVENTSQTNVLRLVCTNALSAEDVMGWFETLDPEFQALATACERPQAWIPGDYDKPFAGPLPDFVNFRMFAQALAARAKASLLLGRPDSALRDVRMIMRLSGVLEQTSPTLVPAMIQVAIAGLIADIVADGLLIGAWQEPQLAALQEELGKVNLLVPLARAFRGGERAGILYALEQSKAHQLAASVRGSDSSVGTLLRDLWSDPLSRYLLLAPRGWIAQNQVRIAWALQTLIGRLDANGKRFVNDTLPNPYRLDQVANRPATPYNYFARFVIPNFARVRETLARNQVLLDMAAIACALERCRAATGSYPETLDALVPRFLSLLTHDIYTGEPLKYRRTPDGKYLLYSVGANLRDDSGTAATTTTTSATPRADDWVWEALPTKR
jgi:hypothetical protein